MTDTTDRPLVPFAVIAYNPERAIREAVEGAYMVYLEKMDFSPRHMHSQTSDTSDNKNDRR